MCLIAFALDPQAGCPLLLASNRDEAFDRPTLPLQRWVSPNGQTLISGRDGRAGGTWLGLGERGRVAWLTNVRENDRRAAPRSRGELPLSWIDGQESFSAWLDRLDPQAYPGFNLVVGDLGQPSWHWISNRHEAGEKGLQAGLQHRRLGPGLYGLSNALLDTPWPKTVKLRQQMAQGLQRQADAAAMDDLLWSALDDLEPADDDRLPRTGVPLQAERALSSVRVLFPEGHYGTRSSTVLRIETASAGRWRAQMEERSWDPSAQGSRRRETLLLSVPAR